MSSSIRLVIDKIFYTRVGQLIICGVFGFALAIMFRKVCKGNCTMYYGPHVDEIQDKIFKLEDTCYKYTPYIIDCKTNKNILEPYDSGNKPENKIKYTIESFISEN